MAAEISSRDIDVLANFEVTVGAQHKKSPISPGSKAVRRKPVDTDVTGPVIPSQHCVAKIFQARVLRVVQVTDLRRNNFSFCGIGEIKKLVELVRANIAEHAAISLALKKPRRALRRILAMRSGAGF